MKLIYSGKTKEFTPELEEKVAAKLGKLGKLVEQRGEREIHLTHQLQRNFHKIEVTFNFYDNALAGEGVDADLPTAINQAFENLEKQLLKVRARWRDTHRDAKGVRSTKESWDDETAPSEEPAQAKRAKTPLNGSPAKPKIFRVNYNDGHKPMTVEEAMLEMGQNTDYVVYRDSDRDCLSVLVRRPDGNFDLIES
jgi:ribosomal subunit interface protein